MRVGESCLPFDTAESRMTSSRVRLALKRFLLGSFEERAATTSHVFWLLITRLIYGWQVKTLGKRAVIRRPLLLRGRKFIHIGDNVHIRDGARLEALQTSASRSPSLHIGDRVNIEQSVHIICHSRVHIGNDVSITGHCAIVDVTHPYEDVMSTVKIGDRIRDEASFVEIGDGAFIGFGSVILPNVRIGRHCVIGANSVVTRDIPDYTVAAGNPAVPVRRYDRASNRWIPIEKSFGNPTVGT